MTALLPTGIRISAPQYRALALAEPAGLRFARRNFHPVDRPWGVIVKSSTVEACRAKGWLTDRCGAWPMTVVLTDAGRAIAESHRRVL